MIFQTQNDAYGPSPSSYLYLPPHPAYHPLYQGKTQSSQSLYGSPDLGIASPSYACGLDDLLYQRREILDARIALLNEDIHQRRYLLHKNLYGINLDQCECRNLIFSRGDKFWDRDRLKLEQTILDLEGEKRKEEASYFRDVLFLRKEMRDVLIEVLEERQKAALFENQPEVQP